MTQEERGAPAPTSPQQPPAQAPAGAQEQPARGSLIEREGSAFDAEHGRRRSRKPWRRLRGWVSWNVVGLIAVVWPFFYKAYCWLVWSTSRVVADEIVPAMLRSGARHGRTIALLWHQEVFTVAWAYRRCHGHTLASAGNFGRIITHMLERCNFVVFRGGSSEGTARRRRVLPLMIRHMREESRPVVYGITVDGSHGPVYRLKGGMLACARACRAPVYVVRCWYRRRFELSTWDRTGFPLPFNRIAMLAVGPYWVPPDSTPDDLERLREHLELELLDLCALSYKLVDGADVVPPGFPGGWTPRWSEGVRGLPFGPHDLQYDAPPPWASQPGPQERRARGGDDSAAADPASELDPELDASVTPDRPADRPAGSSAGEATA